MNYVGPTQIFYILCPSLGLLHLNMSSFSFILSTWPSIVWHLLRLLEFTLYLPIKNAHIRRKYILTCPQPCFTLLIFFPLLYLTFFLFKQYEKLPYDNFIVFLTFYLCNLRRGVWWLNAVYTESKIARTRTHTIIKIIELKNHNQHMCYSTCLQALN